MANPTFFGSALAKASWYPGSHLRPESLISEIVFPNSDLEKSYSELSPKNNVDLVTIGCPQASYEEIERTAKLVNGKELVKGRLWLFTSSENFEKAEEKGLIKIVEDAGGLVLRETCPEVVHYNHSKIKHILTNSMKAEHYLKSGLNSINTSVMKLADCIEHAADPDIIIDEGTGQKTTKRTDSKESRKTDQKGQLSIVGKGLESQEQWIVEEEALVTDVPITSVSYTHLTLPTNREV